VWIRKIVLLEIVLLHQLPSEQIICDYDRINRLILFGNEFIATFVEETFCSITYTSLFWVLFGRVGKTGEGNRIRRDAVTSGCAVLLRDKHGEC